MIAIDSTYLNVTDGLLGLGVANLAVLLDYHSPSTETVAHTCQPAVLLAKVGLRVAHEGDEIAFRDIVDLAPSVHDPSVVRSDDDDLVDTLRLECVALLDEGGYMVDLRQC